MSELEDAKILQRLNKEFYEKRIVPALRRIEAVEQENAELKGIIAGLQDVAAWRVRPLKEIQRELEATDGPKSEPTV